MSSKQERSSAIVFAILVILCFTYAGLYYSAKYDNKQLSKQQKINETNQQIGFELALIQLAQCQTFNIPINQTHSFQTMGIHCLNLNKQEVKK